MRPEFSAYAKLDSSIRPERPARSDVPVVLLEVQIDSAGRPGLPLICIGRAGRPANVIRPPPPPPATFAATRRRAPKTIGHGAAVSITALNGTPGANRRDQNALAATAAAETRRIVCARPGPIIDAADYYCVIINPAAANVRAATESADLLSERRLN